MADEWLIIKRGLFWRPNGCGYTGIRDRAGRYSHAAATARAGNGCTIVLASEAPEFMPLAYNDLVVKYLTGQRDALAAALSLAAERLDARGHKFGAREARAALGIVAPAEQREG